MGRTSLIGLGMHTLTCGERTTPVECSHRRVAATSSGGSKYHVPYICTLKGGMETTNDSAEYRHLTGCLLFGFCFMFLP